jgi:hypothetical protein
VFFVRTVLVPLNVAFRRSLVWVNLQAWHDVVAMVASVQLTNQRDRFVWGYTRVDYSRLNLCTEHYDNTSYTF